MIRPLFAAIALCLLLAQPALAADGTAEVAYLLDFVAGSGCTFTRNGDDHSAPDAANHLRLKYKRGKRYVDSAEQFIDRLATESSWSGDPYTVTCQGATQSSAGWLHRALADYRKSATEANFP